MKAIVLTYNKYHPIAQHMICCYRRIWPGVPFSFRIPFQNESPRDFGETGCSVEFVKTYPGIRDTVLKLVEDLPDEEWIYWCMDDRYPIYLNLEKIVKLYDWVRCLESPEVGGILSVWWKEWWAKENRLQSQSLEGPCGLKFRNRRNFRMIWMHQYLRVKVLRYLFEAVPRNLRNAKEMDKIKDELNIPSDYILYANSDFISGYGESTTRGCVTRNCLDSMKKFGIEVPVGMNVSNQSISRGFPENIVSVAAWRLKYTARSTWETLTERLIRE